MDEDGVEENENVDNLEENNQKTQSYDVDIDEILLCQRFTRNELVLQFLSLLFLSFLLALFLIQLDVIWHNRQPFLPDYMFDDEQAFLYPDYFRYAHNEETWTWDPDKLLLRILVSVLTILSSDKLLETFQEVSNDMSHDRIGQEWNEIFQTVEFACAAHLFVYDEDQALPMKPFFSQYKHSFPMLAVVIDGHYGDTRYDCFENYQVLRIHDYTSQPRVICTDRKSANATDDKYYTLPLNTELGFRKVKGHTSEGEVQTLGAIVEENEFPVLVKLENRSVRVGTGKHNSDELGNLLVQEKYLEHYLWVNCIDTKALKMNSTSCLMALSNKMTITPITGFKFKPQTDFKAFFSKLDQQLKTDGDIFDKTRGNPAFSCYDAEEDTFIYGNHDFKLVKTKRPAPSDKEKPSLPPRSKQDGDDDSPGDYEEMEDAPVLPPRTPKATITSKADKKHKKGVQTLAAKLVNFGKSALKERSSHDKKQQDGSPPIPNKPRVDNTKLHQSQNKNSSKPYENTEMPQAIVKPMPKRDRWSPQPLPTEGSECDDDIYTPMFVGEGTTGGAVDTEDDGELYLVSGDMYLESKLANEPEKNVQPLNVPDGQKPETNVAQDTDGKIQRNLETFTISDVSDVLKQLKLDKYVDAFKDEQIDGEILVQIPREDFVTELNMKKLEALRLVRYIETGHIPK